VPVAELVELAHADRRRSIAQVPEPALRCSAVKPKATCEVEVLADPAGFVEANDRVEVLASAPVDDASGSRQDRRRGDRERGDGQTERVPLQDESAPTADELAGPHKAVDLVERVGMHDRVRVDGHEDLAGRGRDASVSRRGEISMAVTHHTSTGRFGDRLGAVGAAVGHHDDLRVRSDPIDRMLHGGEPAGQQQLLVVRRHDDREPRA
jgi:hypothetical protein